MGFFTGLGGLFGSPPSFTPPKPYLPFNTNKVGHVVDVILDTTHKHYDPSRNRIIGTVFWRDAMSGNGGGLTALKESELLLSANPIDRSNFKVPLPGEQIILFKAKGDRLEGPDVFMTSMYFYSHIVNMTPSISSNTAPFVGVNPNFLNPGLPGRFTISQLARRFDQKIKNLAAFKQGKDIINHKQIQVNEGDFILQGRFGGSIRFTGTPVAGEARNQPWADIPTGQAGDPIVLMRVDNNKMPNGNTDFDKEGYVTEDLQEDAASIYLTTTQQVKFKLAVPEIGEGDAKLAHPLATWAWDLGVVAGETDIENTAGGPSDGETAQSTTKKKSPKEATKTDEIKESDTSSDDNNNNDIPDSISDEQNNAGSPAGYNPVTGQSGVNSTATETGTGNNP